MKFDRKYPNAQHGQTFLFEPGIIIYFDTIRKCEYCKEETHFVEASFECGMCSEECNDKLNEEFWERVRKLDKILENTNRDIKDESVQV
uniref:Uncharacterized protein n=1 Tax=viral metagenome TaxID=1070528 RepID=A0A6M3IM39_9ZZZZ